jgi:hypothetical protein
MNARASHYSGRSSSIQKSLAAFGSIAPKSVARAMPASPRKPLARPMCPLGPGGTGPATSVKRMGEAGAARAIYATVDIVALRARGLLLGGYHG